MSEGRVEDAELVRSFEDCTLPQERWHHREHLRVALHYVTRRPAEAERLMMAGIQRLNAAHGVPQTPSGGYHETLTIAWVRYLKGRLAQGARAQELLAEDGREVMQRYFSPERLASEQARTGWAPPDRQPLPGEGDPC